MTLNEHRAKIKKALPRRGAPRKTAAPLDDNGQIVGQASLLDELPNTPAKHIARSDGPATSRAAAEAISYRTGTQKAVILRLYGIDRDGLTDDEVAHILGWTEVNKARKRCSDLRNEGMIEPNGKTRNGTSGMANDVCAITDRGIATLASMKEPDDRNRTTDPVPARPHIHVWTWRDSTSSVQDCRECGATRSTADIVHTCHPSGLYYDDTCAACREEQR